MESDVWLPEFKRRAEENLEERRAADRSSLTHPALIWRSRTPDDPIPARVLSRSDLGTAFIVPVPLEPGETVDFIMEQGDTQRTRLHVANCECLDEDTYRIGAHI